jgi:Na+-driven multidrug efflux pump
MPRQYFAADAASAPSAAITWESSFTNVEVAFGQSIVTRIPNADPLRTTGLQGQGPDGSNLTLHLVNGPNGEQFVMTRNGNPMIAGSVAWVAAGTPLEYPAATSWAPAGSMAQGAASVQGMQVGPGGFGGHSAADEKVMKTARTWLTVLGSLALVFGILIALFSGSLADQATTNPQLKNIDPDGLRIVGIVLAVLGAVYLGLARLSRGKRAKTMFLIGAIITGLNALANVAQMGSSGATGIIGALISGAAAFFCFKAYKVAKNIKS